MRSCSIKFIYCFVQEKNKLIATIRRFSTFDNIQTFRILQIIVFLVCQPTGIEGHPGLPNIMFI